MGRRLGRITAALTRERVELVDVATAARVRLAHGDVEVARDLVDEHVAREAAPLALADARRGASVLPHALLSLGRDVAKVPALLAVPAMRGGNGKGTA